MRPWFRTSLAVVGLSAAVYACASLTGGWLGTPPWHRPVRLDVTNVRADGTHGQEP